MLSIYRAKNKFNTVKTGKGMRGTDLKEMESGYLYYSLYSYRRKIENDIKNIIRTKSRVAPGIRAKEVSDGSNENLFELTQKLRKISMIISKLITLNKVYK